MNTAHHATYRRYSTPAQASFRPWPSSARERAGEWSTHPDDDVPTALDRLDVAVDEVVAAGLSEVAEQALTRRLERLHRQIARLTAERARVIAELERRRVSATDDPARRASAQRDVRRQIADRTNSTPAATKRDADAGRVADEHRETGATFSDGAISADHVRLIGETLRTLAPEQREAVEAELLAIARETNATEFGKRARGIMARQAPMQADQIARRQHLERRVRSYDTADGGFAFSGLLYGVMAETARAAVQAFRRPDTPGEHRSTEQRSADAFEQLCATALRVGDAPTRHGVRPHVIITIAAEQLRRGEQGVARFGSGQPVTLRQLRPLLSDCTWGRVLLGPDSAPIEASEAVRTVPAGLWRALVARDSGCTWPGCDAPAAWCDVAHGAVAFADGGRLAPANAALLCRRHHRRFDRGGWRIRIEGGHVGFERRRGTNDGPRTPTDPEAPPSRREAPGLPERERPPVDDRPPRAHRPAGHGPGPESATGPAPGPSPPEAARGQPVIAARTTPDDQPTLPFDSHHRSVPTTDTDP